MEPRIQNTMGMAVPFEVPSTIAEFAEAAGVPPDKAEEIVLKFAVDEAMYRVVLPAFRPIFLERLAALLKGERRQTGATIRTDSDGNETEVPTMETDGAFHKRLLKEAGTKPGDYADLAADVANEVGFSIKAKPRSGGRVAKEYYARVDGLREAIAQGKGTWQNVVATLNKLNEDVHLTMNGNDEPDVDALARALKSDAERREREQANQLIPV